MIVVDVETTGTDPAKHAVASIGAVDFDDPMRRFYEQCKIWPGAVIEEEALRVNGYSREELHDQSKKSESEIISNFLVYLAGAKNRILAGQNVHFDLSFIMAAAYRAHQNISVPHRIIDLHSITYYHQLRRGIKPPMKNGHIEINSDSIMYYVGIQAEPKPHIALNGALWETEAFWRLFFDKPLLDQFAQNKIPWL